jgi:hypothetical protein
MSLTSETTLPAGLQTVLAEITAERQRQDARWGEQNHPDGTGLWYAAQAEYERTRTNNAAADGNLTFRHVLAEEVAEAFAESDPAALRAELVQVAAVAAAWIEAIDRRVGARCCEFHDRDPELMPRCGPDDQGGYCCDNCPTLLTQTAAANDLTSAKETC